MNKVVRNIIIGGCVAGVLYGGYKLVTREPYEDKVIYPVYMNSGLQTDNSDIPFIPVIVNEEVEESSNKMVK